MSRRSLFSRQREEVGAVTRQRQSGQKKNRKDNQARTTRRKPTKGDEALVVVPRHDVITEEGRRLSTITSDDSRESLVTNAEY
jgi:ClpP class serine protease